MLLVFVLPRLLRKYVSRRTKELHVLHPKAFVLLQPKDEELKAKRHPGGSRCTTDSW